SATFPAPAATVLGPCRAANRVDGQPLDWSCLPGSTTPGGGDTSPASVPAPRRAFREVPGRPPECRAALARDPARREGAAPAHGVWLPERGHARQCGKRRHGASRLRTLAWRWNSLSRRAPER